MARQSRTRDEGSVPIFLRRALFFDAIRDALLEINLNFSSYEKTEARDGKKAKIVTEWRSEELSSGVFLMIWESRFGYVFGLENDRAPKELHDKISNQIHSRARGLSWMRSGIPMFEIEESRGGAIGLASTLRDWLLVYEQSYPKSLELFHQLEKERSVCKKTEDQISAVVRVAFKTPHNPK